MTMSTRAKWVVIVGLTALFRAGVLILAWIITEKGETTFVGHPVPLGTNELKIGAKLYSPNNPTNLLFTVLDINPAYDFPDDDIRSGMRVKSPNIGGSSWVPRENLNKCLVVQ
jgi:hypothetical protein